MKISFLLPVRRLTWKAGSSLRPAVSLDAPVIGRLAAAIVGSWLVTVAGQSVQGASRLLESRKIWDAAPHNAFTDLIRHRGEWFCVFREGQGHVSPDGALRVITSRDGVKWESAARLTSKDGDLRDAKIVHTPDGRLMLGGAVAYAPSAPARHQSLVWFSDDGRVWSEAAAVAEPNFWLWRVTWRDRMAYGFGYETSGQNFVRLYRSAEGSDGRKFDVWVPRLEIPGEPNESSILFQADGAALCLLRRDGKASSAMLGKSTPPYRDWIWRDVGQHLGGPHMIRVPDGRIVAAGRRVDGGARTSLCWLDAGAATLTEFLRLPSGGDTSYPGLVWFEDVLWVSYYASHDGRTSVYLAKVKL